MYRSGRTTKAPTATIQDAFAEWLDALGFDTMARDVRTETNEARLQRYACIIRKNCPEAWRRALDSRLSKLGY